MPDHYRKGNVGYELSLCHEGCDGIRKGGGGGMLVDFLRPYPWYMGCLHLYPQLPIRRPTNAFCEQESLHLDAPKCPHP